MCEVQHLGTEKCGIEVLDRARRQTCGLLRGSLREHAESLQIGQSEMMWCDDIDRESESSEDDRLCLEQNVLGRQIGSFAQIIVFRIWPRRTNGIWAKGRGRRKQVLINIQDGARGGRLEGELCREVQGRR